MKTPTVVEQRIQEYKDAYYAYHGTYPDITRAGVWILIEDDRSLGGAKIRSADLPPMTERLRQRAAKAHTSTTCIGMFTPEDLRENGFTEFEPSETLYPWAITYFQKRFCDPQGVRYFMNILVDEQRAYHVKTAMYRGGVAYALSFSVRATDTLSYLEDVLFSFWSDNGMGYEDER